MITIIFNNNVYSDIVNLFRAIEILRIYVRSAEDRHIVQEIYQNYNVFLTRHSTEYCRPVQLEHTGTKYNYDVFPALHCAATASYVVTI